MIFIPKACHPDSLNPLRHDVSSCAVVPFESAFSLSKYLLIGMMAVSAIVYTQTVRSDDDSGLYFGVSANRLSADFEDRSDVNFEESDTAGGVQIGYMFSDFFGIEGGYLDLGSYSADGDNPGNAIQLDADAFTAAVVLNFNALEQLDVYAKAGAFLIDAESESRVADQVFKTDDENVEAFGAIGIKADLGAWNAFGELSKVDTDVNELSIDIISLGVRYEFGY